MSGSGAFTALDGERAYMHPYDMIRTPAWLWHDHGNETDTPMIWLDGLEIPLVQMLDASFAEHREDRGAWPTTRPAGDAGMRWGRNTRPVHSGREAGQGNPLFIYPFAEWPETLEVPHRSEAPHPHDAYLMEFTNPINGGPVMKTMSAYTRLAPAGRAADPDRTDQLAIHKQRHGTG